MAGFLVLILISFASYSLFYSKKVYLHQFVGQVNYSGMSKQKLVDKLSENAANVLKNPVNLTFTENNAKYSIKPSDIALSFDINATADNVWQVGRNKKVDLAAFEQLKSIFQKQNHTAVFSYNHDLLNQKIADLAKGVDEDAKDYSISYENGQFALNSQLKEGKKVNQDKLKGIVDSCFASLNCPTISFAREDYKPQISESNAKQSLSLANQILTAGVITLKDGDTNYTVDKDTLAGFVAFQADGDRLNLLPNESRIKAYVVSLSSQIDQIAVDSKLTMTDGKVTVFQPSKDGRTLNQEVTIESLKNVINLRISPNLNATDTKTVALQVDVKKPSVSDSEISSLGINELVGTATTDFKGSPVNRVHNLTVGANDINGVLLKPGEEFSTLSHLGTIDAAGGYLEELVIKGNTTVPDFGGGLCQVSSTLFRAALNAGMKITERQNHSYRVSYYEPPVGMDATIYDPAPDFKFVNNYNGSVLIQSEIVGTKITFNLYGTKDNRKVEISDPVVSDYTNPDPPVYAETDTMPAGQTKRIEKAHQGATAVFDYKVTGADGTVLQQKTFKSVYVPWQERWLVGTGTNVPATCSDGTQDGDETSVDMGGSCPKQS